MRLGNQIDAVLAEIVSDGVEKESLDYFVKKFWREGKKRGRKNREWESLYGALASAIAAAGNDLVVKFHQEIGTLNSQLEILLGTIRTSEEEMKSIPRLEEPEAPAELDSARMASKKGPEGRRRNDQKVLDEAFEFLGRYRHAQELEKRYEINRQQYETQRGRIESLTSALQDARARQVELVQRLKDAPALYSGNFNLLNDKGRVVWARFVDGFNVGRSKIRRPWGLTRRLRARSVARYAARTSTTSPTASFEVTMPATLASVK